MTSRASPASPRANGTCSVWPVPAVEEEGVVGAAHQRRGLVHPAGRRARDLVLRPAGTRSRVPPAPRPTPTTPTHTSPKVPLRQRIPGRPRRTGRRRGHPAVDRDIEAGYGIPGLRAPTAPRRRMPTTADCPGRHLVEAHHGRSPVWTLVTQSRRSPRGSRGIRPLCGSRDRQARPPLWSVCSPMRLTARARTTRLRARRRTRPGKRPQRPWTAA